MKDLKELEKKYEELGKEIERLKAEEDKIKVGHFYKAIEGGVIVLCTDEIGKDQFTFTGTVVMPVGVVYGIGYNSAWWGRIAFYEVTPTWTKV